MYSDPETWELVEVLNEDGSIQASCRRFYTFWTLLMRRTLLGKLVPNSRTVAWKGPSLASAIRNRSRGSFHGFVC